jgi:hypothetical protein
MFEKTPVGFGVSTLSKAATGKNLTELAKSKPKPNARSRSKSSSKSSNRGGGGGGSSSSDGFNAENFSFNATSIEPIRGRVEFSSNVPSGLISKPLQEDTGTYSPLYVMHGQFLNKIPEGTDAYNQMIKEVKYDYSNRAVQKLNYRYDISESEFLQYWNALSGALQMHYTLDSLFAYVNHIPNQNVAMNALRDTVTATDLLKWNRLREMLVEYAAPKGFVQLINFMYQNFGFSEVPGAPIMRLSYDDAFIPFGTEGTSSNLTARLQQCIDDLYSASGTNNKLVKAMPTLRITQLQPSTSEVMVSHDFHTFWRNQIHVAYDNLGVPYYSKGITDKNSVFQYYICENELDGVMFASLCMDMSGQQMPGIWTPSHSLSTSSTNYQVGVRSSIMYYNGYYKQPGQTKFNSIDTKLIASNCGVVDVVVMNTDGTYQSNETNNSPMSQLAQICTYNIQQQAVQNSIRYLTQLPFDA